MEPPARGLTSASSAAAPTQSWTMRRSICQEISPPGEDILRMNHASRVSRTQSDFRLSPATAAGGDDSQHFAGAQRELGFAGDGAGGEQILPRRGGGSVVQAVGAGGAAVGE